MSAHTPGPWTKGLLLDTPTTRSWSREERDRGQESESRMVFANFRVTDLGRSRELIAIVREQKNVPLIEAAPKLLEKLKLAWLALALLGKGRPSIESLVDEIGDLVARIEGAK